ncbi:MAG: hypothetical protein WAN43_02020 [Rhodomicrobium sp.]
MVRHARHEGRAVESAPIILSLSKDEAKRSTFSSILPIVAPESALALIRGRKTLLTLVICDPGYGASAVPG